MKKNLLTDAINAALEEHAAFLADNNNIEEAWFLRGIFDALEGWNSDPATQLSPDPDYPGEYQEVYNAGYESVMVARRVVD